MGCRFLETIRAFGLTQPVANGEDHGVRQRHSQWCLALADHDWWSLDRTRDVAALDQLERKHDNLRTALTWLGHTG